MNYTRKLQELRSQADKEQTLISIHFLNHSKSQWILRENKKWSFFYPFSDEIWLSKVFVNCFTIQESHLKDTQLLAFKFPQSFLIWFVKILSLKTTKKLKIESFYSTQTQAKNRATIFLAPIRNSNTISLEILIPIRATIPSNRDTIPFYRFFNNFITKFWTKFNTKEQDIYT